MSRDDIDSTRRPRGRGALVALLAGAALLFAGFIALGTWQLQRLAWKRDLIARLEQRLGAQPVPAPGRAAWAALERGTDEYKRVTLRGHFAHELETLVQASTELGSGYWVLTPLRSDDGFWALVNRGFVPPDRRAREMRTDRAEGEQQVTGLLRLTEPGGSLLQDNDAAAGRWYSRDVAAIAAARGLAERPPGAVAPYFVDASAPAAAATAATATETWPRPGLTVVRFTNNHLSYALTWYALAGMVAAAAVYVVRDDRRLRARAASSSA
ncbi:SURF1 family protein [Azohydromonas aeria]|uniref:SURF1 family protein n=1 Tax=Azohydromonas aeria TaxID=2590212 RepID=UPI001E5BD14B|nr:SURF1 family protein [Azohydromonas aeria]